MPTTDPHFSKNLQAQEFILYFPQKLDPLSYQEFEAQVASSLRQGYLNFHIDLTKTKHISSSGIGCIIKLHKLISQKGGKLILSGANPSLKTVLENIQLHTLLGVGRVNGAEVVEAYDNLYELMLGEFNLLASLNKVFSLIVSLQDEEEILPMIVRTLAQQLHCPLAVYLQEQGVDSRRLKVAAYAGQLHDALKRFEQLLEENSTIEDSFPGLEQPYVLQRELPIEQWPEALRDAGIEGAILAMPVKADGMPRALLLFAMPEMKKEEEESLLHILTTYAHVCSMAVEKRLLLREAQEQNRQLSDALSLLTKTQQSLIEAGKLANLGVIIASLAHHFNNRLAPILGYSQMLLARDKRVDDDILEKIKKIETAAQGVQHILDSLIGTARQQNLVINERSLVEIIETILNIYEFELKKRNIQLRTEFDSRMPLIEVDVELIEQALLSLLYWQLDRQGEGDQLLLFIRTHWENEMAIVELGGNAPTMDEEERDILLNPFSITRQLDELKTLNLLVVSEIVKAHRGVIEIVSDHGINTVRLILPHRLRSLTES